MLEQHSRDLFDRWEQVWHDGRYDLVPSCVADAYFRHDENGTRTVTPQSYAAELAKLRDERPNIRILVYDHAFEANRAWFRFTFKWSDPTTGAPITRAGMQSYRIEGGKLAETWIALLPPVSVWPDLVAQDTWTRKRPPT
jgi:SnoaL-like polyketide cyclase